MQRADCDDRPIRQHEFLWAMFAMAVFLAGSALLTVGLHAWIRDGREAAPLPPLKG
jgi:hypothetical protein